MNVRKAAPIRPCTESASALSRLGSARPNTATRAPKVARIIAHNSIEPSWLPHRPENL